MPASSPRGARAGLPPRRPQAPLRLLPAVLLSTLSACGGGGGSGSEGRPLPNPGGPPEILLIRSNRDQPHRLTDLVRSDARLIELDTVIDSAGVERDCRIAPDGNRVAYTRDRQSGDSSSRELFIATLDGSVREQRLTVDSTRDDSPTWSPDGTQLVFVSERLGSGDRLFLVDADGSNAAPVFDDGSEQLTPDWSASAGSIVFARFDLASGPRRTLWLLDPVTRLAQPLTDGGTGVATSRVAGDHWPSFSPDGSEVLFARILDDQRSVMARVDVATGTVTLLAEVGATELQRPRFAPQGDRIFYVADRPGDGILSRLLWTVSPAGDEPALMFADSRYDIVGLEPLAAMPAVDARSSDSGEVDLSNAVIAAGIGSRSQGQADDILVEDDVAYGLFTQSFDGRERAGLDLRVRLPLPDPLDMRRVEVSVLARVLDAVPGDVLRIAVRNASERRNDTIAEVPADGGQILRVTLPVAGLSYIDRDSNFGVAVIADKDGMTPGELLIDWIGLRLISAVDPPDAGDGR